MGKISNRLIKLFKAEIEKKVVDIRDMKAGKVKAEKNMSEIRSVESFIKEGRDLNQAVYYNVQNLASVLMDDLILMKPLESIHRFCIKTEDLYQPSYPPNSPITGSFYNLWMMFDVGFGDDQETVGSCILDLADIVGIEGISKTALENFSNSRMGIYKIVKPNGLFYTVREIITDRVYEIKLNSGYVGNEGDLILIRILPSLDDSNIFTCMTTPYQLEGYSEEQWVEYFKRQGISKEILGFEQKLQEHMKSGRERTYWSEFIFWAYLHHRSDVVFLTGLPDQVSTQPHHAKFSDFQTYNRAYSRIEPLLTVQPILTT
jgi:hypothetical protein